MNVENSKIVTKPSVSEALSKLLDSQDGKKDKKISASVWNDFVKDKGGKTIKNSISIENAKKSISIYLARESKRTGKSKENLAAKWFLDMGKSQSETLINKIGDEMEAKLKKERTSPEAIKQDANGIVKFIQGKGEGFPVSSETAAQVFHQVIKNFKGKVPLTLGTHLYLGKLYPALVKQAKNLGLKAPDSVTHSPNASMLQVCKENLNACIQLRNKILAAENKNKV